MGPLTGSWLAQLLGISSTYAFLRSSGVLSDGAKLFLLGFMAETCRRIMRWFMDRFHFPFYIRAKFSSRDPVYQWLVSFLTEENIWLGSRSFHVEARSSQRKWKLKRPDGDDHVDYVPAYGSLHLFRWRSHWLEVQISEKETMFVEGSNGESDGYKSVSILTVKFYTLDNSVLFAFVEECRLRYIENSKPTVTIHSTDSTSMYEKNHWNNVKVKPRRALESLILDKDLLEMLLADAREFLNSEDWYVKAGIPHRRGYLLYGPPGTGKSAFDGVCNVMSSLVLNRAAHDETIQAGELGLDIYTLSLASSHIDDGSLSRAISRLPPRAILLIEDIDCAFPTREDDDELLEMTKNEDPSFSDGRRSQVTLSGLLNALDGVGSEEGKLFFATTNHMERLDPALIRPGRIDRKIEYKLASRGQARAMFRRFFELKTEHSSPYSEGKSECDIHELAEQFAQDVPEHEFSTAQLQGYLLDRKTKPHEAAHSVKDWVEQEREVQRAREARAKLRQETLEAIKMKEKLQANEAMIVGIGAAISQTQAISRERPSSSQSADNSPDAVRDGDPESMMSSRMPGKETETFPKVDMVHPPPEISSLLARDVSGDYS